MVKKLLLRSVISLSIALIISCGKSEESDGDKTVFRYNDASGILTLDPAFSKDQSHIWICQQLYSTLVELDSQLNIRPSVAKSWQLSEDRSTYVFTLRDNIYFNGNELHIVGNDKGVFRRKLVADDLVYSLNRLTDSKLASPGSWIMSGVLQDETGRLTGVKALNDTTIEIRLKSPNPGFLSLLAMPYCSIVPKEVVEAYGHDFRSHPCGTGPFKLAFWKEGVRLVLHKNEYYFEKDRNGRRLPYLDAVSVSFINDKQSAFIEFLKGNLDMLSGLDPSFKDELLTPSGNLQPRHQGRFVLQLQPYLNTEYLGILVDSAAQVMNGSPLLDLRIRQALSYGFDRDRMMTYLRNNVGTPGVYGMVPPGLPSFLPDSSIGYHYDPSKSKRLLADAGFPEGRDLPELVLSTTSTYLDLSEFIKSQWEELGIKVRIDVNQAAVNRKLVSEQKLSFFRGSWIADYPDAENYLSLFYSPNAAPTGPNYTHYSQSYFDSLYRSALIAESDSARYRLYVDMDRAVMEQAPVIVLYYDKVVRMVRPEVEGLVPNAMNLLWLKYVEKK